VTSYSVFIVLRKETTFLHCRAIIINFKRNCHVLPMDGTSGAADAAVQEGPTGLGAQMH